MTHVKEYNKFNGHNSQEDLQYLAKNVFANGKIKEVVHHNYTTNNPKQGAKDGNMVSIDNGSLCFIVESEIAPIKYFIQMVGTTVTNITEQIDY